MKAEPLDIRDKRFLIKRLIEQAPVRTLVREFFKNAAESAVLAQPGNRRIEIYPTMIDNVRKLTFWNTGVGMDDRELKQATDLSSSINKHMALDGNYGIGAKVSGAVFLRTSPTLTTLPGLLSRLGCRFRFGSGMEGESASSPGWRTAARSSSSMRPIYGRETVPSSPGADRRIALHPRSRRLRPRADLPTAPTGGRRCGPRLIRHRMRTVAKERRRPTSHSASDRAPFLPGPSPESRSGPDAVVETGLVTRNTHPNAGFKRR